MEYIVHCGLVYVGETGRSLRSRINGHWSAIKKGGQTLLHRHFDSINQIILWITWECKSLRRFTTVMKIQLFSPQFAEQENCSRSRSLVQPNHMASMTKSKESVPWVASHAGRPTSIVSLINNRDEKDHMEKGTIIKELLSQMLLWALL